MNKTKYKIILAAIKLFNQDGVMNVRNQDIAKTAKMSLSNFNYHYKTKQDLVLAVCEYMSQVLEEKVYGNSIFVRQGQGLAMTRSYFEFEKEFRFFYLDTYNIIKNYPELKEGIEKQIKEAIQIIKNLNYMSIGRGFMKPEPPDFPGLYDKLAEQIWINNHFWLSQMNIRGEKEVSVTKGMEMSFTLIYPYLTNKGKQAYMSYLEEEPTPNAAS